MTDRGIEDLGATVRAGLFDRRTVLLHGELDDALALEVAAQLMTLDATGDEHVELLIDSAGGTLDGALALMDTIELMGVPVHAVCRGRADGPAVGVLATCDERRASRHARLRLAVPPASFDGTVDRVQELVEDHRRRLDAFVSRVAEASGRPAERVAADVERGRSFDAREAMFYGLIDEIVSGPTRRAPRLG